MSIGADADFIIIGAVILIAVIIDQLAHIIQASRRTRKAGEMPPPPAPGGLEVAASKG